MNQQKDQNTAPKPGVGVDAIVSKPGVCKECGSDLGCFVPCDACGGGGYEDEEDVYDAGYATPGEITPCKYCDDGEIYDPDACPYCDINTFEYDREDC